jgi:hypothetical protein
MKTVIGLMLSTSLLVLGPLAAPWPFTDTSETRAFGVLSAEDIPTSGPLPGGCRVVSAEHLGALPLVVNVGGVEVRFVDWKAQSVDGEGLIGFRAESDETVVYRVATEDESFAGESLNWLNPRGVEGPRVHPITSLTMCPLSAQVAAR